MIIEWRLHKTWLMWALFIDGRQVRLEVEGPDDLWVSW